MNLKCNKVIIGKELGLRLHPNIQRKSTVEMNKRKLDSVRSQKETQNTVTCNL